MTYSVKTLYPEFKCLTAHRAIMKRIDTAGKNINTLYKYKDGKHRLKREEGNIHHKLMEALRIDKWWWLSSNKFATMVRKTEAKSVIFREIWDEAHRGEMKALDEIVFEEGRSDDSEYIKECMVRYSDKKKKECPYLYSKGGYYLKHKIMAYEDWIKYEIWNSAKKENFYEAMLKRDEVLGMANSLPDEIVGEIFSFL